MSLFGIVGGGAVSLSGPFCIGFFPSSADNPRSVALELCCSTTATIAMGDACVKQLALVESAPGFGFRMSQFYDRHNRGSIGAPNCMGGPNGCANGLMTGMMTQPFTENPGAPNQQYYWILAAPVACEVCCRYSSCPGLQCFNPAQSTQFQASGYYVQYGGFSPPGYEPYLEANFYATWQMSPTFTWYNAFTTERCAIACEVFYGYSPPNPPAPSYFPAPEQFNSTAQYWSSGGTNPCGQNAWAWDFPFIANSTNVQCCCRVRPFFRVWVGPNTQLCSPPGSFSFRLTYSPE